MPTLPEHLARRRLCGRSHGDRSNEATKTCCRDDRRHLYAITPGVGVRVATRVRAAHAAGTKRIVGGMEQSCTTRRGRHFARYSLVAGAQVCSTHGAEAGCRSGGIGSRDQGRGANHHDRAEPRNEQRGDRTSWSPPDSGRTNGGYAAVARAANNVNNARPMSDWSGVCYCIVIVHTSRLKPDVMACWVMEGRHP